MFQWVENVKNLLWDWLIYPLIAGGSGKSEKVNDPGDSSPDDSGNSDVSSDKG